MAAQAKFKLKTGERKARINLNVKVTDEERRQIRSKARSFEVGVSKWVRYAALNMKPAKCHLTKFEGGVSGKRNYKAKVKKKKGKIRVLKVVATMGAKKKVKTKKVLKKK